LAPPSDERAPREFGLHRVALLDVEIEAVVH